MLELAGAHTETAKTIRFVSFEGFSGGEQGGGNIRDYYF